MVDKIKPLWRPLLAIQYVLVCLFDFLVFPAILIYIDGGEPGTYIEWSPLTLQGNAFYHIAMGAFLGVTSWSRGQEKIAGKA